MARGFEVGKEIQVVCFYLDENRRKKKLISFIVIVQKIHTCQSSRVDLKN